MSDIRDIYQSAMVAGTYTSWQAGNRNVLQVLPTGGGKSKNISRIITDGANQGLREAVLAHRTELVGQMSMHIAEAGVQHRIIAPKATVAAITAVHRKTFNGRSFVHPDAPCAVGAVDTIIARKELLTPWAKQIHRWTIDEAHHVLKSNKWGTAAGMFSNAYGLGVTASPRRRDGMGLGAHHDGVFHDMIVGPTMRELINMGALCDYELVCPTSDLEVDEDDFSKDGDLSPVKGRAASKKSHIVGDVVDRYVQYAFGKRTIVFVTDVETAVEVATRFNLFGITAAAVSADTPDTVRREYIERFKDGRLTVLINVDLFGEGFDVPACECVIMARPTGSLAVYLQQFGRALRLLHGKLFGLIIDMVSNFKRHGFPDKAHYWSLDRRDKKAKSEPDPEEIELTACRKCSRPYERCKPACPYCGAEPPLPVGGVRSLEMVDGDMSLLDRDVLEQMRRAMQLDTPADVSNRVAFATGNDYAGQRAAKLSMERWAAQQRLENVIAQWAAIERSKGRDDRETHKRLYLTAGVDVLSALALSRQDMEALAERIEGWYR